MKKRLLAILLALTLVLSMVPISVAAESAHQHKLCADSACSEHSSVDWQPWSNATTLPLSGQYSISSSSSSNRSGQADR